MCCLSWLLWGVCVCVCVTVFLCLWSVSRGVYSKTNIYGVIVYHTSHLSTGTVANEVLYNIISTLFSNFQINACHVLLVII